MLTYVPARSRRSACASATPPPSRLGRPEVGARTRKVAAGALAKANVMYQRGSARAPSSDRQRHTGWLATVPPGCAARMSRQAWPGSHG